MTEHGDVAKGPGWELRCGRWQDALADVEGDALVTDPPYSERCHKGHDAVKALKGRRPLGYTPWTDYDIAHLCSGLPVEGWRVACTDHTMIHYWESALAFEGLYVFQPIQYVAPGSRVRLAGDGPSSWSLPIVVARPRCKPFSTWGTLPGAYILPPGQSERGMFIGGKPLWLMRALVRDYSRPGDLIIDPCAGSGTTLLAAVIEGRRVVGAEMDQRTFELAAKRLKKGYTPNLPLTTEREAEQIDMTLPLGDASDEQK